ncbi:MAG: formylglycine-generating enzyme family protein [Vicinamibacterales bacterium]
MLALGGLLLACAAAPGPAPAVWTEPATGMAFIKVEPGAFVMGSPASEPGREAQETEHAVRISRPFWLGAHEVTQAEWRAVMDSAPSHFTGNARPVEEITWFEAQDFVRRLAERSPGNRFRLPTEAEWEYACRAGSAAPYATGATLVEGQANVSWAGPIAGATGTTTPVGAFAPNAWGFYDMHGNVWEWTEDEHCPYPAGDASDPLGACGAPLKVIRGGSWYFAADSARCALRYTHRPQDRGFSLGLRIVREDPL